MSVKSSLFINVLYPVLGFAVHLILAIVFNMRLWQAALWEITNERFNGNWWANLLGMWVSFSVCFAGQSSVLGVLMTFMAEHVYKDTRCFHEGKRQEYKPEARDKGHKIFWQNVFVAWITFWGFISNPMNHPLGGNSPYDFLQGHEGHRLLFKIKDISSALVAWAVVATIVQIALVCADVLYGAFHRVQHKFRFLKVWSGHGYHHNFIYPLAMCGPWLSPCDIAISGFLTFLLPIEIPLTFMGGRFLVMQVTGCTWVQSFVLDSLLYGYIHEMNDADHCGKQLPVWSGCPWCPPLGFALNLHKSIPNHEAHHNRGNCGFGLLGVVDFLMGTTGRPIEKNEDDIPKEKVEDEISQVSKVNKRAGGS